MNRNELRQVLDNFDEWPDPDSAEPWELAMTAARRWLDLQPEECGTCDGDGHYVVQSTRGSFETDDLTCLTCHGSGRVYKTETVERIAKAIGQDFLYPDPNNEGNWMGPGIFAARQIAVAVLDALNEADPLDKET